MAPDPNPIQQSLAALIQSLESRQDDGTCAVWLTPRARKDLKALPGLNWSWDGRAKPVEAEAPSTPVPGVSLEPGISPPPVAASRVREEAVAATAELDQALCPPGETREAKLAWLREQAANWPPARRLASLRDTMVFAVGNPHADLVLVGEAPGAEEERRGEPFVGPAGETLTRILQAMGLQREQVYITNIVKFRPAKPDQGQSNRAPTAEEMASCIAFVRAEIAVIQPKVIVALGATASKGLLGLDESLGRMRGRFWEFQGVPVMVTYHPAYLLHQQAGKAEKRKVWEDMLLVMERLGLPISEKQRRFFT